MFKHVDTILLSKIVYLNLPVLAEHATIETLNDPFYWFVPDVCCKASINRYILAVIPFPVDFLIIYR